MARLRPLHDTIAARHTAGRPSGHVSLLPVLQTLIEELQTKCKLDLNVWCADDGTLVGRVPQISEAARILRNSRVALGYHLEVDKSKPWRPTVNVSLLDDLTFEFLEDDVGKR